MISHDPATNRRVDGSIKKFVVNFFERTFSIFYNDRDSAEDTVSSDQ